MVDLDMNRHDILDRLKQNEPALRARGVTHAALFGSRARGDDEPESDADILIETDPLKKLTIYDYVGLKGYIAGLFDGPVDGPVDVVRRDRLKPFVLSEVTAEAIYAF
jgi:hypothetical protein